MPHSFLALALASVLSTINIIQHAHGASTLGSVHSDHRTIKQLLVRSDTMESRDMHSRRSADEVHRAAVLAEPSAAEAAPSAVHQHISAEQLGELEDKYGGMVSAVVRKVFSNSESKGVGWNPSLTNTGENGADGYTVHQGGDRFREAPKGALGIFCHYLWCPSSIYQEKQHAYGDSYAEYLNKLFDSKILIHQVAEVGILKGSGIATWLELFPESDVYGFDIDPSIFESNRENLKKAGMKDAKLKIMKMDQTQDNAKMLKDKVGGKFSFVVDDGCHTEFCARKTIKSFLPMMTDKFVYMIEDGAGKNMLDEIKALGPGIHAEQRDGLTLVSRGL